MFTMGGLMLFSGFIRGKSHCDVYEEGVVGVTMGKKDGARASFGSQQSFDLTYGDIINVTDSGKTICIYTAYGSFEVWAGNRQSREQAVQEIRSRMAGRAAPAAPKAEPEKPAPVAAPTRAPVDDGRVKCPQCGTMQSRARAVCYMCGTSLRED